MSFKKSLRRLGSAFTRRTKFTTSADYWENRYYQGGSSGSGSYNRLAQFKADVLNEFVRTHSIGTILEFGSGDGAQLALADYPSYIGVDVSPTAIDVTRRRFAGDKTKKFVLSSEIDEELSAQLVLSLDVIYHLVEDEVFNSYMNQLFDASTRYVIIYASNEEKGWPGPHVRHRRFTSWIESNRSDFRLVNKIPNKFPYSDRDPDNTSFADFYIFETECLSGNLPT